MVHSLHQHNTTAGHNDQFIHLISLSFIQEFFLLLMKEILDPKYGMFKFFEESRLQWFNPNVRLYSKSLASSCKAIMFNDTLLSFLLNSFLMIHCK